MTSDVIDAPAVAQALTAIPLPPSQIAAQRQLTIVESAARAGASPEQLVQLFQLQRDADNHQLELMREKRRMDEEDRKREALLAFRRDFSAFRGENIVVAKTLRVDRGKAGSFMQAEFHAIAGLLSRALSKHGFGWRHDQRFGTKDFMADGRYESFPAGSMVAESWVYVTCFLEHSDGHYERLDLDGPPDNGTANGLIQNMQSSASMLKRLSLLAITGTATGGEDDENGMRSKTTRCAPNTDQCDAGEADALLDAGREKSTQGMAALTPWWGALTEPQRKALTPEFASLRKAARQFDEGSR